SRSEAVPSNGLAPTERKRSARLSPATSPALEGAASLRYEYVVTPAVEMLPHTRTTSSASSPKSSRSRYPASTSSSGISSTEIGVPSKKRMTRADQVELSPPSKKSR